MPEYPAALVARDRFVLDRRSPRIAPDPWRSHDLIVEDERAADGRVARTGTVLLVGRECPWRCVMCDLWQHTLESDTPPGAIPSQVESARAALGPHAITQLKLYNAGSFFDVRAVPESDYEAIAAPLAGLDRVIVESHPALIGPRLDRWLDALGRTGRGARAAPSLEVAMGLETAHPLALERLHKRMTIEDFLRAAARLQDRHVALRAFLLIWPPFVPAGEQDEWLLRSLDAAWSAGASAVSLVPTRPGNGALEALAAHGVFRAPRLDDIERSVDAAQTHAAGRRRVFVDLWDLDRFSDCARCFPARRARLHAMNLEQQILPRPPCAHAPAAGPAH